MTRTNREMLMEGSFAKELYSESLQLSSAELGYNPIDNVDLQDDDGSLWGVSDEDLDRECDLDQEWQRRHDQSHTIGFRNCTLIAGKEASAQEGFNVGFEQSVLAGYSWGVVRGVTSAVPCLPNELKEKLVGTQ